MANEKRLIDANEAIERAKASDKIVGSSIWETGEVVEFLEDCPTVDAVEVVHGRWDDGECTACGFDIRDMIDGESEFRNWVWEGIPYCPNCGAKMDGDGNE